MNHDNKQVKAETNLTKILLPSVLSILLCMTLRYHSGCHLSH